MSENTQNKDIRTLAYVLRRTNYGEADRILNIITPLGKKSVIAKGVRKPKSKLVGGVEMFTLSEVNIHEGRGDIGVLTGARMIVYYGEIVKDLKKMELAAEMLKKINRVVEVECEGYFKILDEALKFLNTSMSLGIIEAWFLMNLNKEIGEELNLYRDIKGEKLSAEKRYEWEVTEKAFVENTQGTYSVDEIKMLRLMMTNKLEVVLRIKVSDDTINRVLGLIRMTDVS